MLSQLSYAPVRPTNKGQSKRHAACRGNAAARWLRQRPAYRPLRGILPCPRQGKMGQGGLEPPTPRLSSVCSNQLSYWPARLGKTRSRASQGQNTSREKDARAAPIPCRTRRARVSPPGSPPGSRKHRSGARTPTRPNPIRGQASQHILQTRSIVRISRNQGARHPTSQHHP